MQELDFAFKRRPELLSIIGCGLLYFDNYSAWLLRPPKHYFYFEEFGDNEGVTKDMMTINILVGSSSYKFRRILMIKPKNQIKIILVILIDTNQKYIKKIKRLSISIKF